VEEILRLNPAIANDSQAILDLIYNEVVLREQAGETPHLTEYVKRFPALADELRIQFEVHAAIQSDSGTHDLSALPVIPGFDIVREIGQGGMGRVFEAMHHLTERRVAVKLLRWELFSSPEARKRFEIESRIGAILDHPHIVPTITVGECPAGPYLVLKLMADRSLADRIGKGLSPTEAATILAPVCDAVHAAHEAGVIHRDLKPANILFDSSGSPAVSDFGMAKLVPRALAVGFSTTRDGSLMGTPAFMAPEQASGHAPAIAQDVYALGAVVFATLTGRPPYDEGSFVATLIRLRAGGPPPRVQAIRPDLPAAFVAICDRCLATKPTDRYLTAAAVAHELRRVTSSRTARA